MSPDELQQLRQVDRAEVYKKGVVAATLTRTDDGLSFAYLPEWVERQRERVATSLPVRTGPIVRPGGALPAFFTGLLPEGRRLGAASCAA